MPRMTGDRYFAEAVHAYGTTHVDAMSQRAWRPA